MLNTFQNAFIIILALIYSLSIMFNIWISFLVFLRPPQLFYTGHYVVYSTVQKC